MSKIFIPSNCSADVSHFNFNLVLFALVRRSLSGNSIIYATVNKAVIMELPLGERRTKAKSTRLKLK